MGKIARKEELCLANRTGEYIDRLPEIANSGLILYEIRKRLNICAGCNDYTTHEGKMYCFKREYAEIAKKM